MAELEAEISDDTNRMTFAGRPFRLATDKLHKHLDLYYPLGHLRDASPFFPASPAKNLQSLSLPHATDPAPRLNDLWYPTGGTRWATFRGLMTGEDVEAAAELCYHPTVGTGRYPFVMQANGVKVETNLFMLPPRPVVAAAPGRGGDSLHLVTLVDERYYWQQFAGISVTCTDATGTWAGLISELAAALTITLTHTTIESAYGSPEPDSALYSHHENPGALLEAIGHNLGRVLVRKFDGSYELVRYDEADARALARKDGTAAQAGGLVLPFTTDPAPARSAVLPRRVLVSFPRWVTGTGYERPAPEYRDWERSSYPLVHTVTVAAADLGSPYAELPTVDVTHVARTTAKAVFAAAGGGTPTNASQLSDLARQLTRDALWRHAGAADATYPGVFAADPRTAHDLLFAWTGAGKPYTRMSRRGWNFTPVEFQHGFGPVEAGNSDGTAGGCGWAAGLTADDCLEARVISASGACDCEDTDSAPVKLISSNGSSWNQDNEGESSDCAACASGEVPTGVSVTMSAGAGAFATAPTSWFLFAPDPLNPCAQIQQQGDWVLSLDFTQGAIQGFLSNLATSDTAFYQGAEASGCCGALPNMTLGGGAEGAPEITGGTVTCSETPPDPEPEPGSALIICGVPYGVSFTKGDCNGPCMTLKAPGNSGGVYVGVRESCGENSATFAFGGAVCTGERCGAPSRNVVRVRVSWVPCLWDGPGWYCAKDCDTGQIAAVELEEGAQYDAGIQILSGPYEDQAAAEAVCGVSIEGGATCAEAPSLEHNVTYRMTTARDGMWVKTGPSFPDTIAITMTKASSGGGDNLVHHDIPMNLYPFAAHCDDLSFGFFRSGPIGPYADPIQATNPFYIHFLPLDDEVTEVSFTIRIEEY